MKTRKQKSKQANEPTSKVTNINKQTNTKTRKNVKRILPTNKPTRNQIVKSINNQRSN